MSVLNTFVPPDMAILSRTLRNIATGRSMRSAELLGGYMRGCLTKTNMCGAACRRVE